MGSRLWRQQAYLLANCGFTAKCDVLDRTWYRSSVQRQAASWYLTGLAALSAARRFLNELLLNVLHLGEVEWVRMFFDPFG